jgi:hypothetical protein
MAREIEESTQEREEERSVKDWKVFAMEDAYDERSDIPYIIEGMFAQPSLNIMYGPPSCLKSFLLADAAICVAAGKQWLASEDGDEDIGFDTDPEGKPRKVMWIDYDNGKLRTHNRFGALGKAHDVPGDAPLNYVSMEKPWLDSNRGDHIDDLIDIADSAALIIIDNLGTISGGVQENSSKMIQVMANLRHLAEKTGAAVVVIHHQRKGSKNKGSRQGDALRGHSGIEASLDLALQVDRKTNSDVVKVVSTKERGPKIRPFGAAFKYEHKEESHDLDVARFWGCEAEADPKEKEIRLAIREVLKDTKMKKTDFIDAVHDSVHRISETRIRNLVKKLLRNGELVQEKGEGSRPPFMMSLPD